MSQWNYYKAVLHFALWRSWGIALTIATTLDILVPVVLTLAPSWRPILSVLPWRVSLAVFLCLAIVRLALAPYRMHKQVSDELQSVAEQLHQETASLRSNTTRMTVEKFHTFWNELIIHYAAYGYGDVFLEVTPTMISLVRDNKLHVHIEDQLFPIDPVPGKLKELVVIYSHGEKRCQMIQVKQHRFLALPLSSSDLKTLDLLRSTKEHLLSVAAQDDKEIESRIRIVQTDALSQLAAAEPYCACRITFLNTSLFDLTLEGIAGLLTYAENPLSRRPELVENQSITLPHAGYLRISFRQWVTKSLADEIANKQFQFGTALLSVCFSYCNHEGVSKKVTKSIVGNPFTVHPVDSN